jgi:hypothetical protein
MNVRGNGSGAIDAARKIMDDLSSLNRRIGDHLAVNVAKMISTVDLLTEEYPPLPPNSRWMASTCSGIMIQCTETILLTPRLH